MSAQTTSLPPIETQAATAYILHLADNALILGQRNAEWCSNGPTLEEDIALANMSLDLIGQARMLYQLAAKLDPQPGASEDGYAFWRDARAFRNYTLLELPHFAAGGPLGPTAAQPRCYASATARNFVYSALMLLVWTQLAQATPAAPQTQPSAAQQLGAIAAKSVKEVRYHLRHSRDWMLRLGDGTPTSRQRLQTALQHLWPYTQEFWQPSAIERAALTQGLGCDVAALQGQWDGIVDTVLVQATLTRPSAVGPVSTGKQGVQSTHLSMLLAEMQSVARAHPGAVW